MNFLQSKQVLWAVMAAVLLFSIQAAAGEKGKDRGQYVPHEILVKFKPGVVDETEKTGIRKALSATLVKEIKGIDVEYWRLPESADTEAAVEDLNNRPEVEYAEPNYLYAPQMLPNDPGFDKLWYLKNTGQEVNGTDGAPGADISAQAAWDMETGSSDVVIAVIDSGVAVDHPDLKDNIWTNPDEIADNGIDDDNNGYVDDVCGWDFVNRDNNPSDYSKDLYGDGHGTHVAGIIAASGNNGIGTAGIMWHAQIMPLQIFDLFEDSPFNATTINIILAVLYAVENGANIINASFGGPSFSHAQYDTYRLAAQNGVLVVAAAGNGGHNNDDFPTYPANYDLENIISVAATDQSDRLASYSNYGENTVDVAAPGGSGSVSNIYSTTPPKRETMFFDDFESSDDKWVTDGVYEDWSIIFNPDFNSHVAMDSSGSYHEKENSYIRTKEKIQAENFRGLNLSFTTLYQLETNYDKLVIEISPDDIDYTPIHSITGLSVGKERVVVWSNDTEFDDFYLRFRLTSDGSNSYDGVFMDDISLTGIDWKFAGDEYGYKSGTSMATPVVSGLAGLVWSENPDLTCDAVKQIILDSVDPIAELAGKVAAGGRVNAEKAVMAAMPEPDTEPDTNPDTGDGSDAGSDSGGGGGGCFISTLCYK